MCMSSGVMRARSSVRAIRAGSVHRHRSGDGEGKENGNHAVVFVVKAKIAQEAGPVSEVLDIEASPAIMNIQRSCLKPQTDPGQSMAWPFVFARPLCCPITIVSPL